MSNRIQNGVVGSAMSSPDERQPRLRDGQTEQSACRGEQQPFDEELPDDAPASGAERQANRHFACAIGRARELQIRDVHARDQQHAEDRGEHRPERGGCSAGDFSLDVPLGHEAHVLVLPVARPRVTPRWPRARHSPRRSRSRRATGRTLQARARDLRRRPIASGSQTRSCSGKPNEAGMTPTIIVGSPLTWITRPTTPGRAGTASSRRSRQSARPFRRPAVRRLQ